MGISHDDNDDDDDDNYDDDLYIYIVNCKLYQHGKEIFLSENKNCSKTREAMSNTSEHAK